MPPEAGPAASPGASRPLNHMRLELPARAANLALARASVAAFAAQLPFTVDDLDEIKVAVSEAVSNVILHAYPPGPEGMVVVGATLDGELLEVTVADTGRGIADVSQALQPAFTTAPERMGLGFTLMQNFMDEVLVDSAPGRGTKVLLRRRVVREPAAEGNAAADGPNSPQPPL